MEHSTHEHHEHEHTHVLADGTVLQLGGKVVKNSSGYDLKDMVIGSEGTLAFVTKAVLKLLPLPR